MYRITLLMLALMVPAVLVVPPAAADHCSQYSVEEEVLCRAGHANENVIDFILDTFTFLNRTCQDVAPDRVKGFCGTITPP